MKKILVLVLALMLALSCFAAMAEEPLYVSVISKGCLLDTSICV